MKSWGGVLFLGLLLACRPAEQPAPTITAAATPAPTLSVTPLPSMSPAPSATPSTPASPRPVTPTAASTRASTETPVPLRADIVISGPPTGAPIQARVGQVLEIIPPLAGQQWQISFDLDRLALLTPPEAIRNPGPQGWFLRVTAPGVSDIILTTLPPPCPSQTPCPATVARYVYTLRAN